MKGAYFAYTYKYAYYLKLMNALMHDTIIDS